MIKQKIINYLLLILIIIFTFTSFNIIYSDILVNFLIEKFDSNKELFINYINVNDHLPNVNLSNFKVEANPVDNDLTDLCIVAILAVTLAIFGELLRANI